MSDVREAELEDIPIPASETTQSAPPPAAEPNAGPMAPTTTIDFTDVIDHS